MNLHIMAALHTARDKTKNRYCDWSANSIEICRLLIEAGANVDLVEEEDPPLHEALRAKSLPVTLMLLRAGAPAYKFVSDDFLLESETSECHDLVKNWASSPSCLKQMSRLCVRKLLIKESIKTPTFRERLIDLQLPRIMYNYIVEI